MSTKQVTQAERVIAKFGGIPTLVKLFDKARMPRSFSTIARWTYPYGKSGGTGGLIPLSAMVELLELADKNGIKLTSADLDPRPSVK